MTTGPSSIWRSTTATGGKGTEATADSSIQFELTPDGITDATGHLHQTEFRLKSGIGENEKSLAQSNELQDTKFESIIVILTGTMQIHQPPSNLPGAGTRTNNINLIKQWLIEDKVNTTFTKGRFGVRYGDLSEFNLVPQASWGIMIQDCNFIRPSEQQNRVDFIMTLRYNFASMGSAPNYTWT